VLVEPKLVLCLRNTVLSLQKLQMESSWNSLIDPDFGDLFVSWIREEPYGRA
jgi:hypothetical protein